MASTTSTPHAETLVRQVFASGDIQVNGNRPWDIRVHDPRFFRRALEGTMGVGESYMDGWWDCDDIEEFIYRIIRFDLAKNAPLSLKTVLLAARAKVLNMQTKRRARKVAEEHYDLGNDLYEAFLDPYNQYTCGYFRDTESLNEAQEKKLDLICRKLQLKATDRVLDIGCGWGGFAKFAAERYGCHVTGITISDEQVGYAREYCRGLPVEIRREDYRDVSGTYDKVLICGMIEHVGYKNYRTIIECVHRVLADDGIFLLHTIGGNISTPIADSWITKYIFANSMVPSIKQLAGAFEGLFVMEDWHNFGPYYVKTLRSWHANFERNWDSLKEKYGERFRRMWDFYLLSCAGAFRARSIQLWQIVLTKGGLIGGYLAPR